MILHFSYIGLSFIFLVFFLFLLGKFILNFFSLKIDISKSIFLKVFLNLFLGLFTVTLIYSFYKSKFLTINLLFIPLILFLIYKSRPRFRSFNFFSWEEIKGLSCFLFISLVVFSLQISYYYNTNTNSINTIFIDNYYYSDIVKNLNFFGSENVFFSLNKFLPEFRTELIPYRYADMWFSSFIMDVYSINSLESYFLVSTPLIISLIIFLLFCIVNLKIENFYLSFIISLLISFSSILFIPILNPSDKLNYLSETTFMGVFKQKTAFSALFFLTGLFFFKSYQKLSIVLFLSIPILYVAYLPAIWGGSGIYFTINYILKLCKKQLINQYLKFLFLLITLVFLYFIFFQCFGSFFKQIDSFSMRNTPIYKRFFHGFGSDNFLNIKILLKENLQDTISYIYSSTKNLLVGLLFISPFLLFIFSNFKFYKNQLLYVSCLLFVSFLMVLIRDGHGDNDQFFTNTLVFLNLFFSYVFIESILSLNKIKVIYYLLMVLFFCLIPVLKIQYSSHYPISNYAFLSQVKSVCKKNKISTIFCYISKREFNSSYYAASSKNNLIPLSSYFDDISFSLANPEVIKIDKNGKLDLNYYTNVISNLRVKNKDLCDIEIFKRYNIHAFLFYPKSDIPEYFIKNSKTIIKDESEFTFVFI